MSIVLTTLFAVALGLLLWQVSRLNRAVGNDLPGLQREQLAMRVNPLLFTAIAQAGRLRQEIASAAPMRSQSAARRRFQRTLASADDLLQGSTGKRLGVTRAWKRVHQAWEVARRAKSPALAQRQISTLIIAMLTVLAAAEDNSNLSYDRTKIAQNLADVLFSVTPSGLEIAARTRLLVDMATRARRLTLRNRLELANAMVDLQGTFDVTTDNIPLVAQTLALEFPKGHDFSALPKAAAAYTQAGKQVVHAIAKHVILSSGHNLPTALIDARVADALVQTQNLHHLAFTALSADLSHRVQISRLRRRLAFAALLVAIIVLLGLIAIVAQWVARNGRRALHESQREAAHLAAELARGEAEEALRLSEAQFRAVFDGAAVGIAVLDRSGALLDANGVFRALFGDDIASALAGHEEELADVLAARRDTFEFEQHQRTIAGREVWTDATVSVVHANDDAPLFAVCMFRDKTALKHSERRIAHAATHDALTGFPNRQLFEEHLRARLQEAGALLDSFFAVVFVDLQHFKEINEAFGRAIGDSVLAQTATRLRSSVDAQDVVSRVGGDEFAVLIPTLGDILHVESIALRMLNRLSRPIVQDARSIYVNACIGIAIGSGSYASADEVMRDAELALQHAKTSGSTRYAIFNSTMQERAQRRLQLTNDMRAAIERNEFRLLYQPIVSLVGGALLGCEALLRWEHPTEGTINPTEFMPLAEASGLASPIGRFVLQTASSQLAAWRRARSDLGDFTMHVNISAAELLDANFTRELVHCVEENRVAPADLTLEITESVVLDAGTHATATLDDLRMRGFKTCIDDFGTGYSSLRYLQQFKVDAIKIDRGFVSGSDGELASEPIVRTLMALAAAYDVGVVAEGVETPRQRELLSSVGCRRGQGFLFSRPVSAAEFVALYPGVLGRPPRSA